MVVTMVIVMMSSLTSLICIAMANLVLGVQHVFGLC